MSNTHKSWTGVDLDGTLALYDGWQGPDHIGLPVLVMLERVRKWLAEGRTVKLFTARAAIPEQIPPVRAWLDSHGLQVVEITNVKDFGMTELWDDRAVGVIPNKGIPVETMAAYHLSRVLESAGMKVEQGMDYASATQFGSMKIRNAIQCFDDVKAHIEAAKDAMSYVKTDGLPPELDRLGADIARAKRAIEKAVNVINRRKPE